MLQKSVLCVRSSETSPSSSLQTVRKIFQYRFSARDKIFFFFGGNYLGKKFEYVYVASLINVQIAGQVDFSNFSKRKKFVVWKVSGVIASRQIQPFLVFISCTNNKFKNRINIHDAVSANNHVIVLCVFPFHGFSVFSFYGYQCKLLRRRTKGPTSRIFEYMVSVSPNSYYRIFTYNLLYTWSGGICIVQ